MNSKKRRNYIRSKLFIAKKTGKEVVVKTVIEEGLIKETIKYYPCSNLFNGGDLFLTTGIVFEDTDGKSIDLIKNFSPKETFFIRVFYNKKLLNVPNQLREQKEIFFYENSGSNKKCINSFLIYNRITRVGDLLILLHEMGHALNRGRFYKNEEGFILTESKEKAHEEGRIKLRKCEILILYKDDSGKRIPTPIPCDEYIIFNLDRSLDERSAWAYAIKSLRKIRNNGVNIEPRLTQISDFYELIHKCSLGRYEKRLKKEMSLSLGEYENLKGIFSKKSL